MTTTDFEYLAEPFANLPGELSEAIKADLQATQSVLLTLEDIRAIGDRIRSLDAIARQNILTRDPELEQ